MRAVGFILRLVGIAALIAGVVIIFPVITTGSDLVNEAGKIRSTIQERVKSVRELFGDVDVVYQRSASVVKDYESGAISDIHDERVEALLRDINAVMQRSSTVRVQVEDAIKQFEDTSGSAEKRLTDSLMPAAVGLSCLIVSGWLFAIGVALGKKQ